MPQKSKKACHHVLPRDTAEAQQLLHCPQSGSKQENPVWPVETLDQSMVDNRTNGHGHTFDVTVYIYSVDSHQMHRSESLHSATT